MNSVSLQLKNKLFVGSLHGAAFLSVGLLACFVITLVSWSGLSLETFGISFLYDSNWNPTQDHYGAMPFIIGTLLTSILSLLIALPFSLSLSLYIGLYLKAGWQKMFLETLMDLLAGIPSVIYGFWGLMVLVPIMITIQLAIGSIPYGVGIITASLILSIMIIPYAVSLGKEVISLIPKDLIEAGYSLGATPFEVIRYIVIPHCFSGLFAGQLMAFARAISETMAVTMVIGNRNFIPLSLFDPANTLASVIANEFGEASDPLNLSSLMALGLILLVITVIINSIGRLIIKRLQL